MRGQIVGETKELRPSDWRALEKLSLKRSRSEDLIDSDLLKSVSLLAARLGQRIGLLLGRDGRVAHLVLGTKERIYLPDLGRFRLSEARLRRLRFVVLIPHATGEIKAVDRDLITDLEKLRFDALLVVGVAPNGESGAVFFAALEPVPAVKGKVAKVTHVIRTHRYSAYAELKLNFSEFVTELETQFSAITPVGHDTSRDMAILVGAYTGSAVDAQYSMAELEELTRSAGVEVVESIMQRRRELDPRTVIGKGKIEELVLRSLDLGVNLIIFDRELSPSQLRSISNMTELKIIDRSMLILDIFAQRAKSSEGRVQVELAQLKYALPRLTERDSGLSRLSGGIGGRGPGETKLEISRRRTKDRIADLEKRIEKLHDQRSLRRERRQERGVPVVAIVGYTNAGKSTLLNSLTKSQVLVEQKMFATLDPSSRRMRFPNDREVLFVDTVGFIRELPKELLNAFRATLEEVREADVILHLVDATNNELRRQIEVVDQTLDSLNLGEKPRLLVLNKIDLLSDPELGSLENSLNSLAVSAAKRQGFEALILRVQEELRDSFKGQDPGNFLVEALETTLE